MWCCVCESRDEVAFVVVATMFSLGLVLLCARMAHRFSISRFWHDVKDYKCTVFQYIGELCRYLLLGKSTPLEKEHKLRIAIGNGLRPDIWADFQVRRYVLPIAWVSSGRGPCCRRGDHPLCLRHGCRRGSTSRRLASFTAPQRATSRCSTTAAPRTREGV